MGRAKFSFIIGLQVAFLVGILAFSGGMAYRHMGMPEIKPAFLKARLGLEVVTDPAAYQRFVEKRELVAKLAAAVKTVQEGNIPEGGISLGKVDKQDAFGLTLDKTNFVILRGARIAELGEVDAAVKLANAQVGIVKAFPKPSAAGSSLAPDVAIPVSEQLPPFTDARVAAGTEAVVTAPPIAGEIPQLLATIAKTLGEEEGFVVLPAAGVEAQEALSRLSFSRPVFYRGEETQSVTARTTTVADFAEEFAAAAEEDMAEGLQKQGAVASRQYRDLYTRPEHRIYAEKQGVVYGIEEIEPIIVAGEAAKTEGRISTHAILISPVNAPLFVLMPQHVTAEGTPYVLPEASKLGSPQEAMELVGKELLERAVGSSHIVTVGPGQVFAIPAGVAHSIVSPTAKRVFIETLVSAEQRILSVPSYQIMHGGAHRIMREAAQQEISIEQNRAYERHYGAAPALKAGLALQAGMKGTLYSLIAERRLETTKLGELIKEGRIAAPSAELAGYAKRGAVVYTEVPTEELSTAMGMAVGLPAVRASSAGFYQFTPDLRVREIALKEVRATRTISTAEKRVVVESTAWEEYPTLKGYVDERALAGVGSEVPLAQADFKEIITEAKKLAIKDAFKAKGIEELQFKTKAGVGYLLPLLGTAKPAHAVAIWSKPIKPTTAEEKELAEIIRLANAKELKAAGAVDFNALFRVYSQDGKEKIAPICDLSKLITSLNAIDPNFKLNIFSIKGLESSLTEEKMRNLLGQGQSLFNMIIDAQTVTEVVQRVAAQQKIDQDKVAVNLAESTVNEAIKARIDIYGQANEALRLILVKQPKGSYTSIRNVLLQSLRFTSGLLDPMTQAKLRADIENAPDWVLERSVVAEPVSDEQEIRVISHVESTIKA